MAYEQMSKDILAAVGGKENVDRAIHCATRLRLFLKDESKVDKAKVDGIEKVAGSVFSGGQYQIIIGLSVPEVYEAFMKEVGLSTSDSVPQAEEKEGNIFNRFVKATGSTHDTNIWYHGCCRYLKRISCFSCSSWLIKRYRRRLSNLVRPSGWLLLFLTNLGWIQC